MGRGVVYALLNRFFFVVGGYAIHVYVGRALSPVGYGTFGVVLALLTITSIVLNNGVQQAVSRSISNRPGSAKSVYRQGFAVQSFLAVGIGLLVFSAADSIALFFADAALAAPVKICFGVILVQSWFYVQMGVLNGQKQFLSENIIGIVYSIVRPIAVVILIAAGFGVAGAMWGFLAAGILAVTAGIFLLIDIPAGPSDLRLKSLVSGSLFNMVIFGAITVLLHVDLLFVKHFMVNSSGTGIYTAASAFAKPAYWALFSFGTVALPLLTSSFRDGDIPQCRIYLAQVLRYSTLLVLPFVVLVVATSEEFIVFFYTQKYALAHQPLSILVVGIWCVGLISIMAHAMIAIGKEKLMALLSVGAILLDLLLNAMLVPRYGLAGAALATSLSAVLLLAASGMFVSRQIAIKLRPLRLLRLGLLCLLLYLASGTQALAGMPLLIRYVLLYSGFVAGLVLVGEVGAADRVVLQRLYAPRART